MAGKGRRWKRGIVLALAAGATATAAGPGRAEVDSLTVRADVGVGYDLTNQIYFEQTFDSTAITGRTTVSDPETRIQGLADLRLGLFYAGSSRLNLDNRASAGDKLIRNNLRADWRHDLSENWRWVLTNEFDYRRDETFDQLRTDLREAARAGLERRGDDRAGIWRGFYRFDLANTRSEDGPSFYPDYRFHRVSLSYDRFDWEGAEWGLNYTAGYREFPDTSSRNYYDHQAEGRVRWRSLAGRELELRGWVERRAAREDTSFGDRFWASEADLRLVLPTADERWVVGFQGSFQGYSYDQATPTFFHNVLPRAALFGRYERFPHWTVTLRLEAETLRVPNGGGLGDPEVDEDARNALTEEYEQLAFRLDLERLGAGSWFFLNPAVGRRIYRLSTESEADLLSRSDYWFAQVGTFSDWKLGEALRLRLSADLTHERHDVASDDLTSLFLATELRYVFAR